MQKFRIVASKSNKKYNLILTAGSESEARERIHKEWYSILSIKIADNSEIQGTKFIFHIISGWKEKSGVIVGEDIFKSYVKLRKDLGYTVKYLYPEWDAEYLDDQKKSRIIRDLEQWYTLKIEANTSPKVEKKVIDVKEAQDIDNSFYQKKELESTHALIERVLTKLDPIVTEEVDYKLSVERLQKLKTIYNSIVKIKKSTNISKLKEIGELALVKIGIIELEQLEDTRSKNSKELLSQTNKLLKEIGSGKQFKEKNKDIQYMIRSFFSQFKQSGEGASFYDFLGGKKQKKQEIDKESYSFLKTLLLLEKYIEKRKENQKEILKNIVVIFFPFWKNEEKRDKILIKRKVINQNIALLKAKKSWSVGSYTAVSKGGKLVLEFLWEMIKDLTKVLFFVVLFYIIFFLVYLSLIRIWYDFWQFSFNYKWVLYFLMTIMIVILGSVSRGVIMFFLNIVFLAFILIFSVVNF